MWLSRWTKLAGKLATGKARTALLAGATSRSGPALWGRTNNGVSKAPGDTEEDLPSTWLLQRKPSTKSILVGPLRADVALVSPARPTALMHGRWRSWSVRKRRPCLEWRRKT